MDQLARPLPALGVGALEAEHCTMEACGRESLLEGRPRRLRCMNAVIVSRPLITGHGRVRRRLVSERPEMVSEGAL